MNKLVVICFFLFAVKVTAQDKVDGQAQADFMSPFEKEVFNQINILRADPVNYVSNNFSKDIAEIKERIRKGQKYPISVYQTIGDKTDTLQYDYYEVQLHRFENIQKALGLKRPTTPFRIDITFYRLTESEAGEALWGQDSSGYHCTSLAEVSSTARSETPERDFLLDMLYTESSDKVDQAVIDQVLTTMPASILAVHNTERKGKKYPFQFYLSIGYKLKTSKLLSKTTVAGLANEYIQTAMPEADGMVIVGANAVTKISNDNQVMWRKAPPIKGDFEIESYVALRAGGFVMGGWNKVSGRNSLWLFKLDESGKTIWDKNFNVKDGVILSLTEDTDKNGFWAVTSEYKNKKEYDQFIRFFDQDGNSKERWQINLGESSSRFDKDVSIFQMEKGFAVFGATARNTFEGYYFSDPVGGVISSIRGITIDEQIIDRTYANFITLQKPGGGFYATYEAVRLAGEPADYRLVIIDDNWEISDSKWIGGSALDGPSSMVMDKDGNLILAGFSYSGVSGQKTEPAFEQDHCDAWVVKTDSYGDVIWDKTIGGPGCIFQAHVMIKGDKIEVVFKEDTGTSLAVIEEQ